MVKLVIVESPAKCKKIEKYLGRGYKCVASFGHIRQLKDGLKSIDIQNGYKLNFKLISSKGKYIKQLKTNINKASEVILATDDDREGEAIAWHICMTFKLPINKTKRMIFHEITKPAILNAINNTTLLDMNKVRSQQSRMILDVLVGYRVSPLLWKSLGSNNFNLSAGRCQTPALRIIYDQEQLINDNKYDLLYETMGTFIGDEYRFKLNKKIKNEDIMLKFLKLSKTYEHIYNVSDPKLTIKKPPKPLSTSVLQQKGSNMFGYSPKQTMKSAQILYENGLITYMRTDNKKYSPEFIDNAKKYLIKNYGNQYINKDIEKLSLKNKVKGKDKGKGNKKGDSIAQEAHEAIRPTNIDIANINIGEYSNKITNKEIRLYNMIWRITIESCMSDAIYYQIKSTITAPLEYKYSIIEEKVKFLGWKIIEGIGMDNEEYDKLLAIDNGNKLDIININSKSSVDGLKMHYTEAKLISMLEDKGIGRPSTFSSLISKIQDRGYVKKEHIVGKNLDVIDYRLTNKDNKMQIKKITTKRIFGNERNKLKLQTLGKLVLEYLLKNINNVFEYTYTKDMEDRLDNIANGNENWLSLCNECNNNLNGQIKKISNNNDNNKTSHKIDQYHTYMIGRYGPVIKYDNGVDKASWKQVKKDIDIDKLKANEYTLSDILDNTYAKNIIGEYKGEDIVVKTGKYGNYVNFGGKNYSLKFIKKDKTDITLEDVIGAIEYKKTSNVVKQITNYASIRNGKYGQYIFYKTNSMNKPKFIKIPKDKGIDDIDEQWLNNNV